MHHSESQIFFFLSTKEKAKSQDFLETYRASPVSVDVLWSFGCLSYYFSCLSTEEVFY